MSHLWLRAEHKTPERRTPLTPAHAQSLVQLGHIVTVEESSQRIFPIDAYQQAGCAIAPQGAWQDAPLDAYILGLKYLPDTVPVFKHRHIYFAHAFKRQRHAGQLLSRFKQGQGLLLDLECLVDAAGSRVAAFGYFAGIAGAAIAMLLWLRKKQGLCPPYQIPSSYASLSDLCMEIKTQMDIASDQPAALIIGAFGRCGSGAADFLQGIGLTPILWGSEDTKDRDVSGDVLNVDILLNCIFVDDTTKPFLTSKDLMRNQRLSIIADVSCEPDHACNPLPIYTETTSFNNPTYRVWNDNAAIDLMSIDNLPVFLPAESSANFSAQLIGYLEDLLAGDDKTGVWARAADTYYNNLSRLFDADMRKVI